MMRMLKRGAGQLIPSPNPALPIPVLVFVG